MKQITLGECIRSLRIQNHLTQSQLADQLGVTDKAVSKWERNLSVPDITLFPKLAECLGATVNDLLSRCKEECHPSKLIQTFEVSRDIRTPLHIMLGFVEIARQNPDDREMLMKYLEGIRVSGEYLMTLLNGVLQESCCSSEESCCSEFPVEPAALEQYLRERIALRTEQQEDYDFSHARILIVDDMELNREIAVQVLKQTGARTETAEDGLICLQKVEEKPSGYYDLILMDILMPNMNGLEAVRKIRALSDKHKAGIPVIAMTTNVSREDRDAAFEVGMNAFAEKPVLAEKLFAMMSQYLASDV